ncbi:DUF1642 domain-containing protein [Jeotgalibaca porci]|uniref:DUF1642 domain-containing protein n=1 Tax=Jeotgalibaca porci TaxID=1868793 RepID=UPI00359FF1A1
MKKDKEWLKEEVYKLIEGYTSFGGHEHTFITGANVNKLGVLIDQLDEPEKPVIPKFVADWIDAYNLYGNNPLREYIDLESDFNEGWANEEDATVYHWVNKNPYAFIDALRYGYSPSLRAASINIGKAIQEGIDMVNQPSHYKGKHGLEILFEHFATKVEELEE